MSDSGPDHYSKCVFPPLILKVPVVPEAIVGSLMPWGFIKNLWNRAHWRGWFNQPDFGEGDE